MNSKIFAIIIYLISIFSVYILQADVRPFKYAAVNKQNLEVVLPVPQQITYGTYLNLNQACIVKRNNAGQSELIGINDFNDMIISLGKPALPILNESSDTSAYSVLISLEINDPAHANFTTLSELKRAESYVITIETQAQKKIVHCIGSAPRGAYYSMISLLQLLNVKNNDLVLREAEIIDYPILKIRQAHNESHFFLQKYGNTITADPLIHDMNVLSRYKINCVGSGKWAQWHTKSNNVFSVVKDVANYARDTGVIDYYHYVHLATADVLDRADPAMVEEFVNYLKFAHQEGAAHTAVLYDDTHNFSSAEQALFGSEAAANAYVMNEVYAAIRPMAPNASIIYCPAKYNSTADNSVREFASLVPEDVGIINTGPGVWDFTPLSFLQSWTDSCYGRKLFLWDNTGFLEYAEIGYIEVFIFNPYIGITADNQIADWLYDEGGIHFNSYDSRPGPELSHISKMSFGCHTWNPNGYQAENAMKYILRKSYGPELPELFISFREAYLDAKYYSRGLYHLRDKGPSLSIEEQKQLSIKLEAIYARCQILCDSSSLLNEIRGLKNEAISFLATPDNQNYSPFVEAGKDFVTDSFITSLQGLAIDDSFNASTLNISWSKISGPGTVVFSDNTDVETDLTVNTFGTYTLRLSAFDGSLTTTDDIVITFANEIIATPTPIPAATPVETGNLIENGDFEYPFLNTYDATVGAAIYTADYHTGSASGEINGSDSRIVQDISSKIIPDTEYKICVYIKITDSGASWGQPRLRGSQYSDLGTTCWFDTVSENNLSLGWQYLETLKTWTQTDLTENVFVGIKNYGFDGSCLIDDFVVLISSGSTPIPTASPDQGTATPIPTAAATASPLPIASPTMTPLPTGTPISTSSPTVAPGVTATPLSTGEPNNNLIENGDFEATSLDAFDDITGAVLYTADYNRGHASCEITGNDSRISQNISLKLTPYNEYSISAYVKITDSGSSWGQPRMRGSQFSDLGTSRWFEIISENNSDLGWQYLEINKTWTQTDLTEKIYIGFKNYGFNGNCLVDDIIVISTVAATPFPTSSPSSISTPDPTISPTPLPTEEPGDAIIINGDFEKGSLDDFNYNNSLISSDAYDESYAVRIDGNGYISQEVSENLMANSEYIISTWVKVIIEGNSWGAPRLCGSVWSDLGGANYGQDIGIDSIIAGWQYLEYEYSFSALEIEGNINIGVRNFGMPGSVVIDELAIHEIPASGTPAPTNSPATTPQNTIVPTASPEPTIDPTPVVTATPSPDKYFIKNGNFEAGELSDFNIKSAVIDANSYGGVFSCQINPGGYISQECKNLIPGSEYIFSVYIKVIQEGGSWGAPRLTVDKWADLGGANYGVAYAQDRLHIGWQYLQITKTFSEAELSGLVYVGIRHFGMPGISVVDDLKIVETQ